MNIKKEMSRWRQSVKRTLRGLRKLWPVQMVVDLPPWRAIEMPYGRGIALTLEGKDLWLVSPDVTLEPTQEAAICLIAQWCAQENISLRMTETHPSATFLANVQSATALMGSWWKHPAIRFLTPGALTLPPPTAPIVHGKKALFFSGGVDACYSLVKHPDVELLVFIIGWDIPLSNRPAWELNTRLLREIAHRRGIPLVTVFTNRHEHPTLKAMDWAHSHGGLLATVAHCLHRQASNWIISASWWPGNDVSHGSHYELDWRWGHEAITFTHFGIDKWRGEKLSAIAEDAFASRHLMVCWYTSAAGNCGKCEKCVRTRLAHHCEVPGRPCEYMPESPSLQEAVDGLKVVHSHEMLANYVRSRGLLPSEDPLVAAIDRLLERTRLERAHPKPWFVRLKNKILRHLGLSPSAR